jgi:hypothetical protein
MRREADNDGVDSYQLVTPRGPLPWPFSPRSPGDAGWGTSPRTLLNELYSARGAVKFLADTARDLLAGSHPAKQPA